ncbi:MAG: FAD binding domain-containing protein [Gemmataceae bacterium]
MKNFEYYRPFTVAEAVGLLGTSYGTTELLAGGTDLHDLQKEYVAQPTRLVSVNFINTLTGVSTDGNDPPRVVTIGAGAKLGAIASDPTLVRHFPSLTSAAGQVGGPQIRNVATLGGNLCQRNRCWYFRDEHVNCILKGGTECYAQHGENRYHAVFTEGHDCVMVNPSTLAPTLMALGASATVQGPSESPREVELTSFFQAPDQPNEREHVLASNEIVTKVTIPNNNLANASYEVRQKQSYDWPLVQAAVAFRLRNGIATNVRVVLGHVAPIPIMATAAAQALNGQRITQETATAAGRAATGNAKPLQQNGYKVKLIEVSVKRAILLAAGEQPYWEA